MGAQSLLEKEDFSYIVQLYYVSDSYLPEVRKEIEAFQSNYPDSDYLQYLDYLDANVSLKLGEHQRAQAMYRQLLQQDLHPDILSDVYLNLAISLYHTADYQASLRVLTQLESITDQDYYRYQIRVWRGRVYALQGFYLSAENEYRLALSYDPHEVHYDHFLVLLRLDRFAPAQTAQESVSASDPLYSRYQADWLNYLLSRGDYQEFDEHYSERAGTLSLSDPQINLLRVRRAVETEDYRGAQTLLDSLQIESERRDFYQAVIWAHSDAKAEADTLLSNLSRSSDYELAIYAYLERLKIMYGRDPDAAINQLEAFLRSNQVENAEAPFLLGYFHFQRSRFPDAVSQFVTALDYPLTPLLADRIDELIAQSYYLAGEQELSLNAYNRYLNSHPFGKYRDQALYRIGLIYYSNVEYELARLNLEKLLSEHPTSVWIDEARFYLAEISFLKSDYAASGEFYKSIALSDANYSYVLLRLAQVYYYQERYPEAIQLLASVPSLHDDFDAVVLLAGIRFSQGDLERALQIYERAAALAKTEPQLTEAKSYRAYTLYYLKRYEEASRIFYDLAQSNLNADIYLLQAGKAAAQGQEWNRALDLYEQWLDKFPDSPYFLQVLAEIANTQYNRGRYTEALEDWLNLLRRYTSNTFVPNEDLPLLSEAFTGLELSARRGNDPALVDQIIASIDLFNSEYIKFELEYIVVKLFAGLELWDELLREAEELRGSLNLPGERRNAVELLMVQSLMELNRWEQADSLASELYATTQSRESLLRRAEIAERSGNPELALQRYQQAWQEQPAAELWLKMTEVSAENELARFPEIWALGASYHKLYPQTRLLLVQYLYNTGDSAAASAQADSILASEANPWLRANAEYYHGLILYEAQDYQGALRSFRKIRLLYQELSDLYLQASYHYILTLLQLQAGQEALLAYEEIQSGLSEEQRSRIQALLAEADQE